MRFTKITKLSKGWSSYIWLVKDLKKREYVLKEVREKSPRKDLANREGKMLLLANSVKVGPKIKEVNFKKNYVAMEYIHGEKLLDWVFSEEFDKKVTKTQLWELLKELYRQLIALDSVHLSHNQLQVGKNILVKRIEVNDGATDNKSHKLKSEKKYFPVVIDFEKSSIKPNGTKNIGQMESFLFYNPNSAIANKIRDKLGATL